MVCIKIEKEILKCFGEVNSLLGSGKMGIQQCLDSIWMEGGIRFVNLGEENPIDRRDHKV